VPFPSYYNDVSHCIPEEDYIGVLLGKEDLTRVYNELENLTGEYALMIAAKTYVIVGESESSSSAHFLQSSLSLFYSARKGGRHSKAGGLYLQR
jgi:hypothetical protein